MQGLKFDLKMRPVLLMLLLEGGFESREGAVVNQLGGVCLFDKTTPGGELQVARKTEPHRPTGAAGPDCQDQSLFSLIVPSQLSRLTL